MNKKCSRCKQIQDQSEFGKWKYGKDGLRPYCKDCKAEQDKQSKKRNLEYIKHYYSHTPRGRYFRLKENAKNESTFDITADDFIKWWNNQPQTCYYCEQPLTIGVWKQHRLTDLTIDRKDNKQGYTLSNIALACRRCNLMKGDWLTEQQTLEIAQKYLRG